MTIIKQSIIHNAGNGVFASKNYKKGEYICYYDGVDGHISSIEDFIYSIENPATGKNFIGNTKTLCKDGVGQIINDSCRFELESNERNEKSCFTLPSNGDVDNYIDSSIKNANCGFKEYTEENIFKIYAFRDIEENEELYLHYGINYWRNKTKLEHTEEPLLTLYCLMKFNALKKRVYFVK